VTVVGDGVLVGRERERWQLAEVLKAASVDRARAVIVDGEPGMGKTRLAGDAAGVAADLGYAVLWGAATELERDRPFGPLIAALDLCDGSPDPDRAALARLLTAAPDRAVPAIAAHVPELRYRVIEGIASLLERSAAAAPTLLVVDDLHWADESTTLTLAAVLHRVTDVPLVVIATTRFMPRSELMEPAVRAVHTAATTHLTLTPLRATDVERLLEGALGASPGPRLRALARAAGGNPLFIVELIAGLREEGRLNVADGTVEVAPGGSAVEFRRRVLHRLRDVGEDTALLVQVGALLGSAFALDDVATVVGLPLARLVPAVAEAERVGLLATRGHRVAFHHDLVRETIYDDIAPATRAALHRQAGAMLADRGDGAARVARHLALGATRNDATAAAWLHRAAKEAGSRAPNEALDLLTGALRLLPAGDPARHAILADQVEALGWAGRLDECEAVARDALDEATAPALRAALHRHVALCLFLRNQPGAGAAICDAAAEHMTDPLARARAWSEAALAYLAAADLATAGHRAKSAIESGGSAGHPASICLGKAIQSRLATYDLDLATSLRLADEAVIAARSDPTDEADRCQPTLFRLLTLVDLERLDDALTELAEARRSISSTGVAWAVPVYHGLAAVVHLWRAGLDDAEAEANAGVAAAEDVGSPLASIWLHSLLAVTAIHRGELGVAEREVATAHDLMTRQVPLMGIDLLVLAEGRLQEARWGARAACETLSQGWQVFAALGINSCFRVIGPDLVRVASLGGDQAMAAKAAAELELVAATTGLASDVAAAHLARGMVDGTSADLLAAVAAYEASPRPLLLARGCEHAGRAVWADGDRAHAAQLLDRAHVLFADAGADADARRVRELFTALGLRRPRARRRATGGWDSVTIGERKVIDLLAVGHTNQSIADLLGISRRTVETHLSNVYSKLGIGSRVELALAADHRV
jgi:DNA-binding CsgD family transcriptional regulator